MTESVSGLQNPEEPVRMKQEQASYEPLSGVARQTPPPLRQRVVVSGQAPVWTGKTAFTDLFVVESMVPPALGAGPQEKVEYFREKLRRSETLLGRLREAWAVREREVDHLESLWQQAKVQADESMHKVQELSQRMSAMERFLEQKKHEFEQYGQRVTQLFAGKEEALKAAQARIEVLEQALGEAENHSGDARAALEHDVQVRDEALARLKVALEDRRAAVLERDEQNEQLTAELARITDEAVQMRMEYETHLGQLREDMALALEQAALDCKVRDEIIQELRGAVLAQQEASREREERMQGMSDESAMLAANMLEMQQSLEQHAALLMEKENLLAHTKMQVSQYEAQVVVAQENMAAAHMLLASERENFERDRNDMAEAYQMLKTELEHAQQKFSVDKAKQEKYTQAKQELLAAQALLGG
jgi:hypothetical protein